MKPTEKTISIEFTRAELKALHDAILCTRALATMNQHWHPLAALMERIDTHLGEFKVVTIKDSSNE